MKQIVWNSSYEVGVEEIDRQHMEFIRLLRRFYIGVENAVPVNIQLRILQELVKYAEYHFCSEENIMLITKYPDLPAQRTEHFHLLKSLERRADLYRIAPRTAEELSEFLYHWFINHTQIEDRKIADHISRGQKPLAQPTAVESPADTTPTVE